MNTCRLRRLQKAWNNTVFDSREQLNFVRETIMKPGMTVINCFVFVELKIKSNGNSQVDISFDLW